MAKTECSPNKCIKTCPLKNQLKLFFLFFLLSITTSSFHKVLTSGFFDYSAFSQNTSITLPISLCLSLHLRVSKTRYNPILVGRIFSVVEPTIWHLDDSAKYEWPIHRAQWSRLAMARLPLLPPLYSKQYSMVLALFPEINKRGASSGP